MSEQSLTCKTCGQQYFESQNNDKACSVHHPSSTTWHYTTRADTEDSENFEYEYYPCKKPFFCLGASQMEHRLWQEFVRKNQVGHCKKTNLFYRKKLY